MFSGKSEELMRRVRRATLAKKRVQVFKSVLDDRYGIREVISHDQGRLPALMVGTSADLMAAVRPETEVVAIDEIQFMDDGIVAVVNALADRGARVVAAGTDMDFRGLPFGPIGPLLAVAEKVDKLTAICVRCGELASRPRRKVRPSRSAGSSRTKRGAGRATRCRASAGRHRCSSRSWGVGTTGGPLTGLVRSPADGDRGWLGRGYASQSARTSSNSAAMVGCWWRWAASMPRRYASRASSSRPRRRRA
ncbi:MAG: thymidine kinase [Gemmatimonadota bacterium]